MMWFRKCFWCRKRWGHLHWCKYRRLGSLYTHQHYDGLEKGEKWL